MTLQNRAELVEVLREPSRLGHVFARHAYGMRRWVDLFAARIPAAGPEDKELVAGLVADNARHMLIFRVRARAHGVDPDAYVVPPEGEAIYERLAELSSLAACLGYALGSLDHFDELLATYRGAATGRDAAAIDAVRADVGRARARLRPLVGETEGLAGEAHELYRVRELAETPRYASVG
jgi:hypothetical protein